MPTRRGLNRVEAAGYVGISAGTFDRLVDDGKMPGPKRIYGRNVWDVRALDMAFEALENADSAAPNPWDDE